jgi:predicted PurR-regulated permease PerM
MSAVALVVLLSILVTLGLLAVLALALIRHVKLLLAAAGQMQRELQPILEEIQRESERARHRSTSMAERAAAERAGAKLAGRRPTHGWG